MLRKMWKIKQDLIGDCGGMMTVEAAFIIPVIFWILGMCVCFFFFLTDMAVAKSEVRRLSYEIASTTGRDADLYDGSYDIEEDLAERIRGLVREEPDQAGKGQGRLKSRMEERLSITRLSGTGIQESEDSVRVEASIRFVQGLPAISGSRGRWSLRAAAVSLPDRREDRLVRLAAENEREKRGEIR